jgi:hypothetical protein
MMRATVLPFASFPDVESGPVTANSSAVNSRLAQVQLGSPRRGESQPIRVGCHPVHTRMAELLR